MKQTSWTHQERHKAGEDPFRGGWAAAMLARFEPEDANPPTPYEDRWSAALCDNWSMP